jgi:hypothetical protein
MASEPPIGGEPGEMPPDPEGAPRSVEEVVVRALTTPPRTREVLEELRTEDEPPVSDFQVMLEHMISEVKRYSTILAGISVVQATKERILEESKDAPDRVPAWLDAAVYGPPLMTPRLFMHGIAQLMGDQRRDFEQVIDEQVSEPDPILELLADAPIPQAGEEESDSELTQGVAEATRAHMEALVEIARDLDQQLQTLLDAR